MDNIEWITDNSEHYRNHVRLPGKAGAGAGYGYTAGTALPSGGLCRDVVSLAVFPCGGAFRAADGEVIASIKRPFADTCDAIRYRDRGKTAASGECTLADTCNAVRYSDRGKAAAFPKSPIADSCDAVRYSDRDKAAASCERQVADTCDAVRYLIVSTATGRISHESFIVFTQQNSIK